MRILKFIGGMRIVGGVRIFLRFLRVFCFLLEFGILILLVRIIFFWRGLGWVWEFSQWLAYLSWGRGVPDEFDFSKDKAEVEGRMRRSMEAYREDSVEWARNLRRVCVIRRMVVSGDGTRVEEVIKPFEDGYVEH